MKIRFPGLARSSQDSGASVIEDLTGYKPIRDGEDWVVPDNDPQLVAGPKELLQTVVRPYILAIDSYENIAVDFLKNYSTAFEEYRAAHPVPTPRATEGYGFRSELQGIHYRLFFADRSDLTDVLIREVLPFMRTTAGAKSVAPLKISAHRQYGILALAKIAYLAKEFGFEKARTAVLDEGAMTSILPAAPEVLSYVQGFLAFTPLASTLPLDRMGAQLHFFGPGGPWLFYPEATKGIFEMSRSHSLPMSELGRPPFIKLSEHENEQYFLLAVHAANRLLCFINDPRMFADAAGEFDLHRFLKTQSAFHFMFADLSAINHTTSVYLQSRTALSFMDKLSNLKVALSARPQNEDVVFKSLFSAQAGETVASVISQQSHLKHEELGKAFKTCASTIFAGLHHHLSSALPPGHSEQDRLDLIRTFRNTTHGTFLRSKQFEKAFNSSAATIPPELVHVPLLYAWALALDPQQILSF
jgi:hypothetical protein